MATRGKGLENPCGNTKKKMGKICFHLEVETQQAPNNSCGKSSDAVLPVLYSWARAVSNPSVWESRSVPGCSEMWLPLWMCIRT